MNKTSGCVWYLVFMQDELDEVVTTWNSHKIRANAGSGLIWGRPILMYTLSEMYGAEDDLKTIAMEELALCKKECTPKSLLTLNKGWEAPRDAFSAAELYTLLRTEILLNIWGWGIWGILSALKGIIGVGFILIYFWILPNVEYICTSRAFNLNDISCVSSLVMWPMKKKEDLVTHTVQNTNKYTTLFIEHLKFSQTNIANLLLALQELQPQTAFLRHKLTFCSNSIELCECMVKETLHKCGHT